MRELSFHHIKQFQFISNNNSLKLRKKFWDHCFHTLLCRSRNTLGELSLLLTHSVLQSQDILTAIHRVI